MKIAFIFISTLVLFNVFKQPSTKYLLVDVKGNDGKNRLKLEREHYYKISSEHLGVHVGQTSMGII